MLPQIPVGGWRVRLVTTVGGGSLDTYARCLAEALAGAAGVRTLETDVYQRVAELFNVPPLGRTAARAAREDVRFVRRLRRVREPLHLPNHHLARYGRFLSVPYVVTVHALSRSSALRAGGPSSTGPTCATGSTSASTTPASAGRPPSSPSPTPPS